MRTVTLDEKEKYDYKGKRKGYKIIDYDKYHAFQKEKMSSFIFLMIIIFIALIVYYYTGLQEGFSNGYDLASSICGLN